MSLPSDPLDGLLCAFSSDKHRFALATPDGRVRTYDTVSGRLSSSLALGADNQINSNSAANGHLVEGQQCLRWVDSEEFSAEARSSNPAGPSRSWLAVGTSAGAVKVYDSVTGELCWTAAGVNEGGVSCLAFSPCGPGVLVSSGPDGHAVQLDTRSGSKLAQFKGMKHGTSAAVLSADGKKLLLGGSTLALWELEAQQRTLRLTGHPLPVRALDFSPDASCALSSAVGERLVAVWVLPQQAAAKKKSGSAAAVSLAVAQPVVQLATGAAADSEPAGSFYAAATTEAGEVYVWLCRPGGGTGVEAHQVARLAVDPQYKQHEAILAAAVEPSATGVDLVLAVGSAAKPRFERMQLGTRAVKSSKVTFLQPPPNSQGLIQTAGGEAAAGVKAAAAAGSAGAAAEVLGADNAGQAVQLRQSKQSKKRAEPDTPQQTGQEGMDAAWLADGMDTDEERELSTEPTLGQRVVELEKQQRDGEAQEAKADGGQAAPAAAAGQAQVDDAGPSPAALPAGPLKADSLAVLLSQALRSSDRALLERCLAVGSPRIITNSVQRLVPMDAALLLRAAVERLQAKPSRGQQLAAWIKAVLLYHTAYLMSAPAAAPVMSSLYQIIESRLAMQRQLLSLAGRLDLLLSQRTPGSSGEDAAVADAAQVVYQESDSEADVEIVDAVGGRLSESDDESGDYTTDEGEDDEDDGLSSASESDEGGSSDDDDEAEGMEEDSQSDDD